MLPVWVQAILTALPVRNITEQLLELSEMYSCENTNCFSLFFVDIMKKALPACAVAKDKAITNKKIHKIQNIVDIPWIDCGHFFTKRCIDCLRSRKLAVASGLALRHMVTPGHIGTWASKIHRSIHPASKSLHFSSLPKHEFSKKKWEICVWEIQAW